MTLTDMGFDALEQLLGDIPSREYLGISALWHLKVWPEWEHRSPVLAKDLRLLFVRNGQGTYWVEGQEIPLRRGTIIFLGRGARFSFTHEKADPPTIVPVRFECYDNATGVAVKQELPRIALCLKVDDVAPWETLFLELAACYAHRDDALCLQAQSGALQLILARLYRQLCVRQGSGMDARVQSIRQRIAQDPLESVTVGELAWSVQCSADHLSRLFRKATGESLARYRLRCRMEYAAMLLREPGTTARQVADLLGYSDAFVFSRQFKRILGQSPSQIRKSMS